jgi:hypothetical protein
MQIAVRNEEGEVGKQGIKRWKFLIYIYKKKGFPLNFSGQKYRNLHDYVTLWFKYLSLRFVFKRFSFLCVLKFEELFDAAVCPRKLYRFVIFVSPLAMLFNNRLKY